MNSERLMQAVRAINGGSAKKPTDVSSFLLASRQLGYDDVAIWVSTHPAEFQSWLLVATGNFEEVSAIIEQEED